MSTTLYPSMLAAQQAAGQYARPPMVWDPVSHLLSRFTFGADPASRRTLQVQGPDAWWAAQVSLGQAHLGYSANAAVAAQGPRLSLSAAGARAWLKANGNEYGFHVLDELTRVTIGLQAWSPAQLYETVVDFFANHLNVANHNTALWCTRHVMDRDVVRAHAFGSYTDMLLASARNPAMLQYLNLASSNKTAVNENYGRELLELHTVGVGARYSEADVVNCARLLTGRTVDANSNYLYVGDWHWTGPVSVLGFSNANSTAAGGEAAGDALLRYLAAHPSTANRLATKLCQRFVSDTPSASLVAAVANAYLSSGTQILPMLSAIVHSAEFWASRGAKVRRPAEHVYATIRTLGATPVDLAGALQTLHWILLNLGNLPLEWPAPNGYPDVATSWRSSAALVTEWSLHRGFVQNAFASFASFNPTTLYGTAKPATSGEAIDVLTTRLTGMVFPTAHKAALQTFLAEPASTPFASSQLRWYLVHLVPVILDAAQHALR